MGSVPLAADAAQLAHGRKRHHPVAGGERRHRRPLRRRRRAPLARRARAQRHRHLDPGGRRRHVGQRLCDARRRRSAAPDLRSDLVRSRGRPARARADADAPLSGRRRAVDPRPCAAAPRALGRRGAHGAARGAVAAAAAVPEPPRSARPPHGAGRGGGDLRRHAVGERARRGRALRRADRPGTGGPGGRLRDRSAGNARARAARREGRGSDPSSRRRSASHPRDRDVASAPAGRAA